MVRDVVQDGAGLVEKERFAFKDHNNIFSCLAAARKFVLLKSNHDTKSKMVKQTGGERESGESPLGGERLAAQPGGRRIGKATGEVMRAAHGK